ncbi:hypothetical protein F5Y14DRAFT_395049 [Nemania sp. NC0429]|nr:hypothetical protein F5Y14DRAFT_395049 [Nemania sp. NC0429]
MTMAYLRNLGRFILSLIFLHAISLSFTSASSSPAASPAAEPELICHTDNLAECYPKVFSATEEFQVVRDDQDLPPGLHVQLDVQTGRKQAKLYNPDDEENPALAGLPVDREVIVVDPELPQDDEPRIPAGAPAYEPVGMVKAPREKNEEFSVALQTIKKSSDSQQSTDTSALDAALYLLDDLSHDMYYGLQVAEDAEAVQSLLCLLLNRDDSEEEGRAFEERVDFLASSILSAAVGNNARALATIEKSWDSIAGQRCKAHAHSIKHELFHRLTPTSEPGTKQEVEESKSLRLYVAVISGLLKSPKIRAEFLDADGMQSFLRILLREGGAWESRKAKVARVVADTFLDEDFGATLGLWPKKRQVDDGRCAGSEPQSLNDECWEHHLVRISQGVGAPEWSERLLSLLRRTPISSSGQNTPPRHNEL